MNYGTNTPAGFLPGSPTADDLLGALASKVGSWDEINGGAAGKPLAEPARDEAAEAYAWLANQPQGQIILEDILNMTLRRSCYLDNSKGEFTLEQNTAYGLERKGQNGLAVSIFAKIVKGQHMRAPKPARRKKA